MSETAVTYAELTSDGGWRVFGSRISLDSVVRAYWDGRSPEAVAGDFPSLTLEQVHGAIAFYLRNRAQIDRYMAAQDARWEQLRVESELTNRPLLGKVRAMRQP